MGVGGGERCCLVQLIDLIEQPRMHAVVMTGVVHVARGTLEGPAVVEVQELVRRKRCTVVRRIARRLCAGGRSEWGGVGVGSRVLINLYEFKFKRGKKYSRQKTKIQKKNLPCEGDNDTPPTATFL